ncbi:MAG TPA: hypothetical protein VI035_03995 [Solirubrobacterales bacterium]
MADGVNRTMNAVESTCLDAAGNGVLSEAGVSELGCAHHTVLPSGDLGEDPVALGAKVAHIATKAPTPVPSPL